MPATEGDAVALRPLADVFAIATAKLIPLAVNVIDDVALFRPSRFDRRASHFSDFRGREDCTAFEGAATHGDSHRRRPQSRKDAHRADSHQSLSAHPHRRVLHYSA